MRNRIKILALLLVAVLTATATGYASEAAIGYQPPTVVQTVEAEMPAVQGLVFQGWEAGLAVTYANQQGCSNVGLQAVVGKTLDDLWEWRCTASVNGLIPQDGFDRYVTALTGPVFKLKPFYVFVQVGAAYNPSTEYKIGIAANTGAGVAFDIGKRSRIFVEADIDAVPTGGVLCSTFSAGVGYAVRL
jgi:hypothetical protein